MVHLLGYARVSTTEQNPDLQVNELTAAGCWRVWTDHASGALDRRPQLDDVLEQLRPGDTLVVWRLDRLGRSLRHLIEVVTGLDERGVGFRSLRENIDTTTAGGRLVFHLFGALAQFERELIRDRTVAGLTAARARGRVGGRPSKLSVEQVRQARRMYDARELTVEQIGDVLGVSRTSIYRALGKTTTPAPACPAEPVATATEAAGDAPPAVATGVPASVGGAPGVVRSRGRSRWFVVEADPADPEHGPVAVVSGHASQKAATAALSRARSRASSGAGGGGAAAGPRRRPDQFPAGVGQPGQAGRCAARTAALTGRLNNHRSSCPQDFNELLHHDGPVGRCLKHLLDDVGWGGVGMSRGHRPGDSLGLDVSARQRCPSLVDSRRVHAAPGHLGGRPCGAGPAQTSATCGPRPVGGPRAGRPTLGAG